MAEEKTKPKEDERSVEEMFQELNQLLAAMEDENATLEQSFANYEKGMKLVQACKARIDGVEKKVQLLASDGSLQEFT
ncbi:MAG: exodeoxyribonuclease VII small subunit [Lachnospiraceae bacterium]